MVRITQNLLSDRSLLYLNRSMERLTRSQETVNTGRLINKPSDDPVAFPQSLSLRSAITQGRGYLRNIETAKSNLDLSESTLATLTDTLQTIRALAVQGGNNADPANRQTLAVQVKELYGQILDLANTQVKGQPLFGGSQTQGTAFVSQGDSILYTGDDYQREVAIGKGTTAVSNITGAQAFLHTPHSITGSLSIADITAPLADQLLQANPNFPNLPPWPSSPAGAVAVPSPNAANSPMASPNNYATFYIYDQEIHVDLSVDSLADVRDRINATVKDVTAEINSQNQLVLTSKRSVALDLRDGVRTTGYPADAPQGVNLLGALGLHRSVEGARNLGFGYPAGDPLTVASTSPAPARSVVRVQNNSFLFALANTGPSSSAAVPFGDNLALTNVDEKGNEVLLADGSPEFIEELEAVRVTIGNDMIDIDLRVLTTGHEFDGVAGNGDDIPGSKLEDLLNLINNHPSLKGRVTAYINANGTGIALSATESTEVFKVENTRRLFGRDLTTRITADPATGEPVVTRTATITSETKLDDLPGALVDSTAGSQGIRRSAQAAAGSEADLNWGLFTISNGESTDTIDLRDAITVGDVIQAVNKSSAGVEARINDAGTGIDIVSIKPGSGPLSVTDTFTGTIARDLGWFSPPPPARIQSTGGLSGESTLSAAFPAVTDGAFTIEVRDGAGRTLDAYTIEVKTTDTVNDLVRKIDAADGKAGPGGRLLSASLEDGVLSITSLFGGYTLLIDSSRDTTGTFASRITEQLNINQYTAVTEDQAAALLPYASRQNTASILGINQTGTVNEVEEKNVFRSIKNLENALRNDDTEGILETLDNLDTDLAAVLQTRTQLGARLNRLDAVQSRLEEGDDLLVQNLSQNEDADLAEAIFELTLSETAFQAALQVTARILQQSLLDFL
ncbi:MAG: flagellar hook-associated protein FlgL [bacterium]